MRGEKKYARLLRRHARLEGELVRVRDAMAEILDGHLEPEEVDRRELKWSEGEASGEFDLAGSLSEELERHRIEEELPERPASPREGGGARRRAGSRP